MGSELFKVEVMPIKTTAEVAAALDAVEQDMVHIRSKAEGTVKNMHAANRDGLRKFRNGIVNKSAEIHELIQVIEQRVTAAGGVPTEEQVNEHDHLVYSHVMYDAALLFVDELYVKLERARLKDSTDG